MASKRRPDNAPGKVTIREDVPTAAVCRGGQLTPRAFCWCGEWLTVAAVVRHWQGYHQGHTLHFWTLSAGQGRAFTACYHPGSLVWIVEELAGEGQAAPVEKAAAT